ncbi:MAG: arginine repressor [Anaerovoracaceae bacterium]
MRNKRHNAIIDLISNNEIETQEKLCDLLKKEGFNVTQATVSRDIKELQLVKDLSASNKYKYSIRQDNNGPINDRFVKIFKETIIKVDYAENQIIVKTLSGCGPAAGEAIDSLKFDHVVGSIAGDNTILLIVDSKENVPGLIEEFNKIL